MEKIFEKRVQKFKLKVWNKKFRWNSMNFLYCCSTCCRVRILFCLESSSISAHELSTVDVILLCPVWLRYFMSSKFAHRMGMKIFLSSRAKFKKWSISKLFYLPKALQFFILRKFLKDKIIRITRNKSIKRYIFNSYA